MLSIRSRLLNGSVDDVLGGSATFFCYAASFFTSPRLVGVVGEDFPAEHRRLFDQRGVDTSGLTTQPGKTFRWKGRYHQDMNTRDTLEVHLNVFATFDPELPELSATAASCVLGQRQPDAPGKVLDQVRKPRLVLAETMDLWINSQRPDLLKLLPRLDGLFLNDSEAKLLTGDDNLVRAGHAVRRMGPKFIILKKGEHGRFLLSRDGTYVLPAYPTENVVDPTGAGDSFAGGILGYLTSDDTPPPGRLRRAMAYGTVVASLTVEGFGLDGLKRAAREEIDLCLDNYRTMLSF